MFHKARDCADAQCMKLGFSIRIRIEKRRKHSPEHLFDSFRYPIDVLEAVDWRLYVDLVLRDNGGSGPQNFQLFSAVFLWVFVRAVVPAVGSVFQT